MLLVDRGNKDLFDVTRDLILDEEVETNVRLFLRFGCERESKKEWCIKRVEKGLCKVADMYFGGLWHEISQE